MKNIIFNISGGLGKNIIATAVIRAVKKAYPDSDITVTTPHRDVWLHNPRVNRIINPEGTPEFYRDFIHGKDALIMRHDPYLAESFIYRRKHLTETWCDLAGVPYDGLKPELYFTPRETAAVQKLLGPGRILLIQTSGGAAIQSYPISWARDLPLSVAERVAVTMKKLGWRPIHIRRPDQPALPPESAEYINMSHRQALIAVSLSDRRLFMDSFAQHAAAAFELPSIVAWISNSPEVFGYPIHNNIVPKAAEAFRHHPDSYLDEYDITGKPEEYPYETNELFEPKNIVEALLR